MKRTITKKKREITDFKKKGLEQSLFFPIDLGFVYLTLSNHTYIS